ncbi:pyridoxamine 5'-phosphate oxidase family protein [Rhodococcus globerulus]|uniref:pyridoxamine 5'-phosphate oxidase family protein n=1 Tax=Rhodococcus globerulus TaxID=33008 RepID=UPI00374E2096
MCNWEEFKNEVPDFANSVSRLFDTKSAILATLRLDGSSRVSGVDLVIDETNVWWPMGEGSVKLADVRRDPRVALHGEPRPAPAGPASLWDGDGDAKMAGHAVEVADSRDHPPRIELDIREVVWTHVDTDNRTVLVDSWIEGRGLQRRVARG